LTWLCYQGRCPAIIDGVLVSPDGSHVTPEFARLITPILNEQVKTALKTSKGVAEVGTTITTSKVANQDYLSTLNVWQKKIILGVGQLSTKNLVPSFSQSAGKDVFANPDCNQRFSITGIAFDGLNPCKTLGGSKNAIFLGNSHARMLQSTVAGGLKKNGYNTYSISTGSCTLANVTPMINGEPTPRCDKFRADAAALIQKIKPSLIVVSESIANASRSYLPPGVSSKSGVSSDQNRFWDEYLKSMKQLAKSTKKLIVIGQAPYLRKDPTDCVDSSGQMSSECSGDPTNIQSTVNAQKNIIGVVGGDFIDLRNWLCTSSVCPAIIDNTLAYSDLSHISYPIQSKLLSIFEVYVSTMGIKTSGKTSYTPSSVNDYPQILKSWKSVVTASAEIYSTKNLNPSFNETAGKDVFDNPNCKNRFILAGISVAKFGACYFAGGKKIAVLIGNSHARMIQYTVSNALLERGYTIYALSMGNCLISNVTPVVNGERITQCKEFRAATQALLAQKKPELIVLSQADGPYANSYLPPGSDSMQDLSKDTTKYWNEYRKALSNIKTPATTLIVIGETPTLGKDPSDCVDSSGNISRDCAASPSQMQSTVKNASEAVNAVGGNFVDARDWLCTEKSCPIIIDNTLAYTNLSHISYPFEKKITPLFKSFLTSISL